jgi:hypothetical protein
VVRGSDCLGRQRGSLDTLRRRAQAVEDAEQHMGHVDEVGILVHRALGAAAATDLDSHRAGLVPTFRLALHPMVDLPTPL